MKMYGVVCTSSVIHNYYISLLDLFLYCLLLPYQFTEHFSYSFIYKYNGSM